MPSSTFSSNSIRRKLSAGAITAFAVGFVLSALLGEAAFRQGLGWRGNLSLGEFSFKDHVLREAYQEQPDIYFMLYYGIGEAIERARAADVLVLGNSRALFAFREDSLQRMEEKTGLKFFNMSLDRSSRFPLALDIIRRNGLRPGLVIVNDDDFFTDALSPADKETLNSNVWQCRMKIIEHRVSWNIRYRLHRWIPRSGLFRLHGAMPVFLWRSLQRGGIVADNFPLKRFPINGKKNEFKDTEEYLESAKQFKTEMERLGIGMVLTLAPTENSNDRLWEISTVLRVPVVQPVLEGLETFDHSHLTKDSAKRFSDDFLRQFSGLAEVSALRNRKRANPPSAP